MKRKAEFPVSSVSPEMLKTQGAKLLDVLAVRLPEWAAGQEKLSDKDVRRFARKTGFTGENMAHLYRDVCGEHLPALSIIFYGMIKGDVPLTIIKAAIDQNPLHRWDATPVIENLKKKYKRYEYNEAAGDPFRPNPPGSDPDGFNNG